MIVFWNKVEPRVEEQGTATIQNQALANSKARDEETKELEGSRCWMRFGGFERVDEVDVQKGDNGSWRSQTRDTVYLI